MCIYINTEYWPEHCFRNIQKRSIDRCPSELADRILKAVLLADCGVELIGHRLKLKNNNQKHHNMENTIPIDVILEKKHGKT